MRQTLQSGGRARANGHTICALCSFSTDRFVEMKIHFLTFHPESCSEANLLNAAPPPAPPAKVVIPKTKIPEKRMNCKYCSEASLTESELRAHLESSHPENCWKCPNCSKVMLSPDEMPKHFEVGCSNDVCPGGGEEEEEGEEETTVGTIDVHKTASELCTINLRFMDTGCKRCSIVFQTMEDLRSHVKDIHPNDYFPCDFCPKVSFTGRALLAHLYDVHRPEKTPGVIPAREALRKSSPSYKTFRIACKICSTLIPVSYYSKTHLRNDHGIEEDCTLQCKFCLINYKSRVRYLTHVEEFHGDQADMKEVLESVRTVHANLDAIEIQVLGILSGS